MEQAWLEATIEALQTAQIPAQRGFPNGLLPSLTEKLAAVSIQKSEEQSMTVLVQIYMPVEQGATACEDTALVAAAALRDAGAQCTIGACTFSSKSGLFCIPLQTSYAEQSAPSQSGTVAQPKVQVNGQTVGNVTDVATSFSSTSVKSKDASTGDIIMVAGETRWRVTIEDLVKTTLSPQEPVEDSFTVVITRGNEKESYDGCCWEKVTSDVTSAGIKRVRVAVTCNAPVVSSVS